MKFITGAVIGIANIFVISLLVRFLSDITLELL